MSDPRRMSEFQLQGYVVGILRFCTRQDVLWLHIPNEGKRTGQYGAHLVRMGMLPGAADFLVIVRGKAFFLELKAAKGRLSPEQWAFREAAVAAGAAYEVVRTPEQAKAVLASWGALRPDSMADIVAGMRVPA